MYSLSLFNSLALRSAGNMMVSGEHHPLDGSLPHELTSKTPFPSLKLYVLIGILSLSSLSLALLVYLCIRLSRTSKTRKLLVTGTNSRASFGPTHEIFLSFRGPDIRNGFTDFLYRGMDDAGILVFRDNESLRVGKRIGDELLQAIENCKIYIPIFSKNYASSYWCLQELAYMVECTSKSNENKEILPIFLDAEPDDVKLKTNLYSKALSKHQKIFCTKVVESWKKALIDVGKIKGWNLKKDESQADLMQSVIETVLAKLNVRFKKKLTEDLVGVDDRVEAIIKMLDVESDGVQFLGIHGMGGIGKTTLAKVIFNQLSSSFHGCSFLSDVRESSQHHGMVYLQKQLLSKFLDSRSIDQIHDIDDGINLIKGVLCNKKILIVLDDVDEKEQLKSLAEKGSWFGSGSRIIITTRNQHVLTIDGEATSEGPVKNPTIVSTYEVQEMEFDHALRLFSRHAFRRDSPPNHYVSLSKELVSTLGKLPLALEVTGSSLSGKSEALWVDTWKKLKEAPHMEVQRKLMITYERLDHAQKQVFLDIACFFVNEDKTYPFYMWDACGYCPHNALEVLFLLSLIKIKDNDTFWMHDQVRDLGREIVRQENFDDPCKRSRVWNHVEALIIMERKEGSRKMKALSLGFHEDIILKHDEFANLRHLRFFQGDGVSLVGDFNNLLPSLTWLSWHCCPSKFEATNFHPTNLVVLDLSESDILEERIGWISAARKLKVLDLSYCKNLRRTLDLSTLVSLERLKLHGCKKIKKLPDSVGKLQSLIELDLSGTGIGHLPDSIGNLKQLTILRMSNMKGLTKLPSAIWLLEKLVVLDANECWNLTGEIPKEIGRLSHLRILGLSDTRISRLPNTVSCLSNLQELELNGSDIIQLPELPPSLTCLRWCNHAELESVSTLPTSISTLSRLKKLTVASPNVRFLPQLPSSLRKLTLQGLATTHSPDFSNLKNLSTLKFCRCSMLEFSGIFDAELEKLYMERCTFTKLDTLFRLEMKRLTILWLCRCEFLPEVLDLSHMKNLQDVTLCKCKSLVEIHGLEELGSLSSLRVWSCSSIERMSNLSKLRKLWSLRVGECPKLRSVEGLNLLESLKLLWIRDCRSLESLDDTSNLDLECFQILRCEQLPDHHSYCKPGRDCLCEWLFEGLHEIQAEASPASITRTPACSVGKEVRA